MAEGKPRKRTKFALLVAILVLALGLSAMLLITPGNQPSPESMQSSVPAPESTFGSSLESEEKSEDALSAPEDDGCTPPATVPDIDLLPGEYLEYVAYEECKWDLVLWNSEGDGTLVSPESQCRPMPQDPEDGSGFYLELVPCEYTLVLITDSGDLQLVDPSEAAKKAWESGSTTVEETLAQPRTPSASGSSNERGNTENGNSSATPESSQGEETEPIPLPPIPSEQIVCPQTSEENPEVYEACRAGFEPPVRVVFTGIVQCVKSYETDPVVLGEVRPGRQPVYTMTLGLQLEGGNFFNTHWGGAANEQTGPRTALLQMGKTYGLGEGPFDDYAVPIMSNPDVTVLFESMDSRYPGVIYRGEYSYASDQRTNMLHSDLKACNQAAVDGGRVSAGCPHLSTFR